MTDNKFRLSGLLPIRDLAPTFATPLLTKKGSNQEFIQEVDADLQLTGTIEAESPDNLSIIRDICEVDVDLNEGTHFAFIGAKDSPLFGTLEQIHDDLSMFGWSIEHSPYLQKSIARLLKDKGLENRAEEIIRTQSTSDIARSEKRRFENINISAKFYRAQKSYNLIVKDYLLNKNLNLSIESYFNSISNKTNIEKFQKNISTSPKEEQNFLANMINTAISYSQISGGYLSKPGSTAFYLSSTQEGATSAFSSHYFRMASSMNSTSRLALENLTLEFCMTEWKIDANLVDITNEPLTEYSSADKRELGEHIRSLKSDGIYYRSETTNDYCICLFNLNCILDASIYDSNFIQIDDGGNYRLINM